MLCGMPITSRIRTLAVRQSARGQGLVEFAIVLPVLAVLLFGIIQFGMIFGAQVGLTNAVREAARYASTSPVSTTSGTTGLADATYCYLTGAARARAPTCTQPGIVKQYVLGYNESKLDPAHTSVTYCSYTDPGGSTSSIRVIVKITYNHPLFIPLISSIVDGVDGTPMDGALTGSASEQFRVENAPLNSTDITACP